jgi:DNA-binding protein H-NS
MVKTNLTSMSVDALLKLRDDIGEVLSRKAHELKQQLSRLSGGSSTRRTPKRSRTGKKVAPKYRGPGGATWTGRGLKPRWLSAELKSGKKIDDFLIASGAAKKSRRKK